jgi:hypothetical protein
MDDGVGDNHFGMEERAPRQQPVEEAAMAVRPVHHGRDGDLMSLIFRHLYRISQNCPTVRRLPLYAILRRNTTRLRPLGRSKASASCLLKDRLGTVRLTDLDRECLIEFG